MKKKKSPKEIIESVENPEFEESWFKLPGEEIKVNSISQSRGKRGVTRDKGKVRAEINLSGRKYKDYVYAGIHTHPGFNKEDIDQAYPSSIDLLSLLSDPDRKSETVALTSSTGKLLSYGIIRKTKKTPPPSYFFQVGELKNPISRFLFSTGLYNSSSEPKNYMEMSDRVLQEYPRI